MANTKSAIKAARQSLVRKDRNNAVKSRLKTLSRKLVALQATDKKDETRAAAIEYVSALDKAIKSHVVHANAAARYKSRLSKITLGLA